MVKVEFTSIDHVENPRNPISLPDLLLYPHWKESKAANNFHSLLKEERMLHASVEGQSDSSVFEGG